MTDLNFPIVDPHIHQWDPWTTPRRVSALVKLLRGRRLPMELAARLLFPKRTLEGVGKIDYVVNPYLPAQYGSDTGQFTVSHIVHVEAGWDDHSPMGPVGETEWVAGLDCAAGGFELGAIVAAADPADPGFRDLLAAHAGASDKLRGIRAQAAWDDDRGMHNWYEHAGRYRDAAFLEGFRHLADAGLRFDAWVYSPQIGDVTTLAKEYPEVPIMLDHLGSPVGVFGPVGRYRGADEKLREETFELWQHSLATLAEQPNAHVKLSGLLMPLTGHGLHKRAGPASAAEIAELIEPFVNHALDVFGPERCLWASNFPMDKVAASLETVIEAYARVVAERGETVLRQVFRDNALKFYAIDA